MANIMAVIPRLSKRTRQRPEYEVRTCICISQAQYAKRTKVLLAVCNLINLKTYAYKVSSEVEIRSPCSVPLIGNVNILQASYYLYLTRTGLVLPTKPQEARCHALQPPLVPCPRSLPQATPTTVNLLHSRICGQQRR